jgi:hypothetical protein
MHQIEVAEETLRNFHLFWDNFPSPVMLVHKDRTIIEVNKAGQEIGCPIGARCVDLGEKSHHAGCRANKALRDQIGVREVAYYDHLNQVIDGYWIPLAGAADLYVHFGIDITEFAAERLLPQQKAKGTHGCDSCSCE